MPTSSHVLIRSQNFGIVKNRITVTIFFACDAQAVRSLHTAYPFLLPYFIFPNSFLLVKMQLTFEGLQSTLTELSAFIQFFVAILGLIAIILPFFQRISFHDDSPTILPSFITSLLHQIFTRLNIPQLLMYLRPQEYYDNLLKKLNG